MQRLLRLLFLRTRQHQVQLQRLRRLRFFASTGAESRTARTAEAPLSASTAAESRTAKTAEDPLSASTAAKSRDARTAEDPLCASTAAESRDARTAEDPLSASTAASSTAARTAGHFAPRPRPNEAALRRAAHFASRRPAMHLAGGRLPRMLPLPPSSPFPACRARCCIRCPMPWHMPHASSIRPPSLLIKTTRSLSPPPSADGGMRSRPARARCAARGVPAPCAPEMERALEREPPRARWAVAVICARPVQVTV
jgi:hypothetical protein